jgi:hypothetical protein
MNCFVIHSNPQKRGIDQSNITLFGDNMKEILALPNSPESLAPLVADGRLPKRRVWGMLFLRSALTFGLLLLVSSGYAVSKSADPVGQSAAWWLWYVMIAGGLCIYLMWYFGKKEGLRLRDIYFINRSTWKGDLIWAFISIVGIAILAQPPGTMLANALWGGTTYPNSMLFQPLPIFAVYPLFILMPAIHALAELPTYFGYVAPRLRAMRINRWVVILITGAVLSVQHMFFSFQLDAQYDFWLAVKFLPFALWMAFILDHRPTAMPYLMAGHFLLDLSLPYLLLLVSQGLSIF